MSTTPYPLKTYDELMDTAVPFAEWKIPLMVLIGTPGLGKSWALERACAGMPFLSISGKKSPFDLYIDLHRHRDELVILDDVDTLLRDDDGKVLLRQLTETTSVKTVSWGSQTKTLDNLNPPVPRSFQTRSHVCLITNMWRSTGIMKAIESRAVLFEFSPSWIEAYKYAATWFHDQEILDYVHGNLGVMKDPDLRELGKAATLRTIGKDWTTLFDKFVIGGQGQATRRKRQAEVQRLLALDMPMEERVRQFEAGGWGDRATFYRDKKEILATEPQAIPPRIIVPTPATTTVGATSPKSTKASKAASRKPVRRLAGVGSRRTTKMSPKAKRKPRKTSKGRKPLPK